ncbi:MAG: M28 family peptidase [Bryobacterales bacterium]|jgi:Zn-dependent M28 family amino/carboxypeptidase|nr:M28 family peptidase [Bryobacterales bacterium]
MRLIRFAFAACFVFATLGTHASAQSDAIQGRRIAAHTRFLASDALEGRGVGVRGGDLATDYIATQLELMGLQPAGDNGTYFQNFQMAGVQTQDTATLAVVRDGQPTALRWLADWVGNSMLQQAETTFEAEAVFVGHGIVAPEFQWNDYKNVDVKGKIVVLFTNEPGRDDPKLFKGKALMYYGRWSYKYEEALRQGALGAIILHTDDTAGYEWGVVRNSWGREQQQVLRQPGEARLAVAAWLHSRATPALLAASGKTADELMAMAGKRDFQPLPLGVKVRGSLPAKVRTMDTRNVAALVPGSLPAASGEHILFSAHWDHLGIGPSVTGDKIFNGAVDNATGCAVVLELARAWAGLERKPRRSALFVFVTAEESGLHGSAYYATHPVLPLAKNYVNLNYDGLLPGGRLANVVINGAERTSLWPLVQRMAQRFSLRIDSDPAPEQGYFYRSDHFSMAKAGVPAFSINPGEEYVGKPASYGKEINAAYRADAYHKPTDEYQESWDFSGLEQLAKFGFALGMEAAAAEGTSTWQPGDEFQAAREASLRQQE